MLYQTNPAFPKEVQNYGCYFMSLLRMAELVSNTDLTVDQVNAIYVSGSQKGYITRKCSCVKPDSILKEAFFLTSAKFIAYQVGAKTYGNNPRTDWWQWVRTNPKFMEVDYLLVQFATGGGFGTHYCLADKNENVIYDPYNKPYKRLDMLGSHIYRVF